MSDDAAKQLWSAAMTFDQRSWLAAGTEGAQGVEAWMIQNPHAWLNDMRRPDIDQGYRDKVFVVVGEAGSGKSTLMDLISARETRAGNMAIYFDFKNAPLLVGQTQTDSVLEALYQTMREKVELAVEDLGLLPSLRAARIRFAVRKFTTEPFARLRTDYPGIKNYTDSELLACSEAEDLTLEYEEKQTREFITLMACQFLTTISRTTYLIDNVEGLNARSRQLLFELLTAVQTANTLVVVAIRSEHIRETARLPQARPAHPYQLAHDRPSFMKIARIRNSGALTYARQFFEGVQLERAENLHSAFESSLQVIEASDYLYALFTGWLNENVRDFLDLLADISGVLPSLKGRSVNGYVSARLLEKHAHPSLARIFDPRPQHTTKYKDLAFVFLPLRLLSYLQHRNSRVSMRDLLADFHEAFGIKEGEVRRAIDMLAEAETGKPYLLRLEEDDGGEQVHLVRCGQTFIRQVVLQCDYLQTLFDQVEDPPTLPRGLNYSETKLRKSLAVIDHLILPSFMLEHPYCDGRRATNRMRSRLFAYEQMFSYRSGHWFVGGLYRSIKNYVDDREGVGNLSAIAAPTLARLKSMGDRLDAVSRGAR